MDLYIPSKCSAINGLITSKDHTSVRINFGHLVESLCELRIDSTLEHGWPAITNKRAILGDVIRVLNQLEPESQESKEMRRVNLMEDDLNIAVDNGFIRVYNHNTIDGKGVCEGDKGLVLFEHFIASNEVMSLLLRSLNQIRKSRGKWLL
ncbi:40S ribosomal protein S21 [Tanacetum coccineum]